MKSFARYIPARRFSTKPNANGYGLYDMIGNVWEWTTDWHYTHYPCEAEGPCCVSRNPQGAPRALSYNPTQPEIRIPRKVIKGGSYLCAPNYCRLCAVSLRN